MNKSIYDIASDVAARLKILSHPKRLVLLCLLAEGEQNVSALASQSGMRDAAVSQQLMLLRKDGVVNIRREGQMVFYRLHDPDMAAILTFLHAQFCPPAPKKKARR